MPLHNDLLNSTMSSYMTFGIALMTLATYMANGYNAHYDVTTIAIASYSYSNHGLWYSDMH